MILHDGRVVGEIVGEIVRTHHHAFDAYNYEMPGTHLHKLQIGHGNCMVFSQPFMYSIAPAGSAGIRL